MNILEDQLDINGVELVLLLVVNNIIMAQDPLAFLENSSGSWSQARKHFNG